MKRWLLDLFYFSGLWFFYTLFLTIILFIPVIIITGNAEMLTGDLEPGILLAFQIPILISTLFLGKIITKNRIGAFLNFDLSQIFIGFGIGFMIIGIFVLFQIILKTTIFSWQGFTFNMIIPFIMYILVAFNEELLFRSLLFGHLVKKMEVKSAIVLCSLIFALVHLGNDNINWLGFINISLFGVLMSLFYIKYKSLSIPIGAHFAWNFFQGSIFGYAVSGYKENSLLSADITKYAAYLNGGNFGAEGSLLLFIITLVFIFYVLFSDKFFYAKFLRK
jgi:membrane protease YdiL (CAAX protease family)